MSLGDAEAAHCDAEAAHCDGGFILREEDFILRTDVASFSLSPSRKHTLVLILSSQKFSL